MVALIGAMAKAHGEAIERINEPEPEMAPSLQLARSLCPRGTAIYLASALDKRGDDFEAALRALDHRCPVQILRITDAFETAAPKGRFPIMRSDGRRLSARAAPLDKEAELAEFKRWDIAAALVDAAIEPHQSLAQDMLHG